MIDVLACITESREIPVRPVTGAGVLTAGSRVLLTAFGGGASWGAVTLEWPDLPRS